MNTVATLQGMGLTLAVATGGKLAMDGLGRLSNEERETAVTLAKEHKAEIIDYLSKKSGGQSARTLPPFCRVDCPDRIGEPCQNLLKGTWQVVRYPPERIEAEGTVYRCKKHWHELEATE